MQCISVRSIQGKATQSSKVAMGPVVSPVAHPCCSKFMCSLGLPAQQFIFSAMSCASIIAGGTLTCTYLEEYKCCQLDEAPHVHCINNKRVCACVCVCVQLPPK